MRVTPCTTWPPKWPGIFFNYSVEIEGFVVGLMEVWAHTITHDINAQMAHCCLIKKGLTTEVKGCSLRIHWVTSCIQTAAWCFVVTAELLSLVRNWSQAAYMLLYPCEDPLPQLNYKKIPHLIINEKTGTVCLALSPTKRSAVSPRASNFPSLSGSLWGTHVYVSMCYRRGILYIHVMLSHP